MIDDNDSDDDDDDDDDDDYYRVVTKGRGPGIFPGYSEHGPRLL